MKKLTLLLFLAVSISFAQKTEFKGTLLDKDKYKQTPYIKSITAFTSKYNKKKAKFRIRIFSKDSISNLPNEDLLKKDIIISLKKRDKKAQVDVSKYNIEIPKNGFFLALERLHIPYNFFEYEMKYKDSITEKIMRVAPDFGGIRVSGQKMYTYQKGKWFSRSSTFVPAISVTLSN